jgi:hypothetical protein
MMRKQKTGIFKKIQIPRKKSKILTILLSNSFYQTPKTPKLFKLAKSTSLLKKNSRIMKEWSKPKFLTISKTNNTSKAILKINRTSKTPS